MERFGYCEKEQDTRVPLCEKSIDLRMADGLWRQNQKIEQEAEVPTCENSEIRLPKPSTEAGFNSVQPLDITVEK